MLLRCVRRLQPSNIFYLLMIIFCFARLLKQKLILSTTFLTSREGHLARLSISRNLRYFSVLTQKMTWETLSNPFLEFLWWLELENTLEFLLSLVGIRNLFLIFWKIGSKVASIIGPINTYPRQAKKFFSNLVLRRFQLIVWVFTFFHQLYKMKFKRWWTLSGRTQEIVKEKELIDLVGKNWQWTRNLVA